MKPYQLDHFLSMKFTCYIFQLIQPTLTVKPWHEIDRYEYFLSLKGDADVLIVFF